jgi:protein O-mannosyl-transferase
LTADGRFLVAAGTLVVALVLVAASPALNNGFLNYDDPGMIVDNPRLDDPSASDVIGAFGELREHAYLPLYVIALMPEAALAGKNPFAFHGASSAWHAAIALAVLGFVLSLTRSRVAALVAAGVFAAHPVLAESTAWASGRKDQVSLLLLLASLGAALAHLRRGGGATWIATPALLVLALLAKGTVVVQPLLLLLTVAVVRAEPGGVSTKARARSLILISCVVAGAGAALHYLVARAEGAAATDPTSGTHLERAATFLAALGRYAWNVVLPVRLSIHYDLRPDGFGLAHAAGLVVLVGGVVAAARCARARADSPRFIAFACAWMVASLLPFNGVFPRSSLAMADRYLAVAMVMVGLPLGLLAARLPRVAGVAAIVAVFAALTLAARPRYAEFKDGETVFRGAMRLDDADPLPPLKVGEAVRKGPPPRPAAAAAHFAAAAARSRDPVREARARVLAADASVEAGLFAEAAAEHARLDELIAKHGPLLAEFGLDLRTVRFNAVAAELGVGRPLEARERLERVLAESPDFGPAKLLRADLDRRRAFETLAGAADPGLIDRARETVNRSLVAIREVADAADRRRRDARLSSSERADAARLALAARADLARTSARASWRPNFLNEALAEAERLVREFPSKAEAYLVRAEVLEGVAPGDAARDAESAAKVEPENPAALRAVANALLKTGRNQDALTVLLAAKAVAPDDAAVARAVADVFVAAGRARLDARDGSRDLGKARTAAREARSHVRDDPAAWTLEGECAEAEKDWDLAASCFEAARRSDPEYGPAKRGLARAHQARGLALLLSAGEAPGSRTASRRGGLKDETLERALAEFRSAVRLGGESDEVDFARARVRAEDRRETVDPLLARARGALARQSPAEALSVAEAAIRLDDAYDAAWETLGHAAVAAGNHARAFEAFKRTVELDPEHLAANLSLARLHWRRGEYAEAKARAARFLKLAEGFEDTGFLEEQRKIARDVITAHDELMKSR